MGIGSWYLNHPAGDLADWWDKQKKESEHALYDFVDSHPHYWAVAAAVQTGMDVGSGIVDVLRFGQGMAEYHETARIGPLIQDTFRGLSIASGAAKVLGSSAIAGRAGPALGRAIGLYEDVAPGKAICSPIAVANAIRRTGQRFMLSLDDVAAAHGKAGGILNAEWISMDESVAALKNLKIEHEVIPSATSWENLGRFLEGRRGVLMARIVASRGTATHRIVVEATKDGMRIIDRTGIYENAGFAGFARSLEQLSGRYAKALNGAKWILDPAKKAVLVRSAVARISTSMPNGFPTLMGYVNAFLPRLQGHYTTKHLDARLQSFKSGAAGSRSVHK